MPQILTLAILVWVGYLVYRGFQRLLGRSLESPPPDGRARGPVLEIEAHACKVCRAFVADGAVCNRPDCPR
jgi:hypothetical protein